MINNNWLKLILRNIWYRSVLFSFLFFLPSEMSNFKNILFRANDPSFLSLQLFITKKKTDLFDGLMILCVATIFFVRLFTVLCLCIKSKGIYCFTKNTIFDFNKCEIGFDLIVIMHILCNWYAHSQYHLDVISVSCTLCALVPSVRWRYMMAQGWVFESNYVSIIAKGKTFE